MPSDLLPQALQYRDEPSGRKYRGTTGVPGRPCSGHQRVHAETPRLYPLFPQRRYTPGQPLFPARADDTEQYLETFYYELDPQFSTNADFKVAKILANDMLSVYLMGELESLESTNLRNMVLPLPDVRPTWQDSKTDLTELIYLLDSKGCFGNVPLTQLASYISNAFNVHLDMNLSRTFCDMKSETTRHRGLTRRKRPCLNVCRRGSETRKRQFRVEYEPVKHSIPYRNTDNQRCI